jgi:hypothetical protein
VKQKQKGKSHRIRSAREPLPLNPLKNKSLPQKNECQFNALAESFLLGQKLTAMG